MKLIMTDIKEARRNLIQVGSSWILRPSNANEVPFHIDRIVDDIAFDDRKQTALALDTIYESWTRVENWGPQHICESCRRVFNTTRALDDHRSRVGTSFDDCNRHVSENARLNTERVQRALESGALVVGAYVELHGGFVYKLEGRVVSASPDETPTWAATLISKSPRNTGSIGFTYTLLESSLLEGRIVGEPKFTLPKTENETKTDMALADECGRLRHKLSEVAAQLRVSSDALSDVMAWLGPTKVREFERWREKTRK